MMIVGCAACRTADCADLQSASTANCQNKHHWLANTRTGQLEKRHALKINAKNVGACNLVLIRSFHAEMHLHRYRCSIHCRSLSSVPCKYERVKSTATMLDTPVQKHLYPLLVHTFRHAALAFAFPSSLPLASISPCSCGPV